VIASTNQENEYVLLWRLTVAALVEQGCDAADAVEGANLVLEAYKGLHAQNATSQRGSNDVDRLGSGDIRGATARRIGNA
jgi:hypothetical protein